MSKCNLIAVLHKVTEKILSGNFEAIEEKDGFIIHPKALVLYDGFLCPMWTGKSINLYPLLLKEGELIISKNYQTLLGEVEGIEDRINRWNKYCSEKPIQLVWKTDN